MATFYDYENRTAFDPHTQQGAPNATGSVYAKTDTTFSTPLTVVMMSSGLQAIELTSDQYSQLPGFQVDGHLQVVFKSGDFTKVLNTTTPLVGPAGPAVADAVDNGDGTVTFTLPDGSPAATVALPPGPQGDPGPAGLPATGAADDDAAIKTFMTTPGTATNTALSATVAGQVEPLSKEKTRRRNAIRRAHESRVTLVNPPTGMEWAKDLINVFKAGSGYVTDFDVANFKSTASATTIYMNSDTGLDTNAGTEAAPVKAFWKAYELCPAGGTIMVLNKGTIYRNTAGWSTTQIKKTVNIVAKYPGETIVSASDNLTFTLTAGQTRVYQAARTNVIRVIDIGAGETGYEYPLQASVAACAALPGSYYHDGTNVYINTLDGKAPNPARHLALLSIEQFVVKADTAPMALYLEGFTIVGGNSGNLMADSVSQQLDVYAKNCKFLYTTNSGSNSVNIHGARRAFFQDCVAANSRKDGFNYTSFSTGSVQRDFTKFIEVNCRAFSHGFPSPSQAGVNNASTAHAGCQGVRIGGTYYETDGAVVADVQTGTKSANYSCAIYDSLATANNQGISAQQAGAEMWVYACQVFGNDYDLYMVTGTTAVVDETEFDTRTGGGTVTITNPA